VCGLELVQIADFRVENNLKTGDVIQCRECGYDILQVAYASE
jgi:DNA-directed RNA polymerase subunit RPC12/RpoP